MPARLPLQGRVAVITGGNRGIGLALARAFAINGCHGIIVGRDARALKSTIAELGKTKGELTPLRCDVTNPTDVEKLFAVIRQRHSTIDILVNNAGVAHPLAPVEQLPVETWKRVVDTNLTGMFLCTRLALPFMKAGATIVNNLSLAALQPFEGMAAYNASKAGALGFTNVLRAELRTRGIRVVALVPGATDTDLWQQFWQEAPRAKMVSADTVAEAVLHVVTLPANTTIEEIRLGPTAGAL
jgi:NAD(P)-dependent dehydrogenase (short-subunit alcohol dehydrogenase family)